MDTRDASDVNAEYARLLAKSDDYSRQIARLMEDTQRIAKWDRWIPPLSAFSLCISLMALYVL